jgi:hypothetical protein
MLAQYFSIMGPDDWLVCEVTTIRTVINILIYTSVCVCVRARACECEWECVCVSEWVSVCVQVSECVRYSEERAVFYFSE